MMKGGSDISTKLEEIDTHLRQEAHEMTLNHTLTVLGEKFLGNCSMSDIVVPPVTEGTALNFNGQIVFEIIENQE